jgi:predicted NBD/HSP70 family sugar kinase
MLRTCAPSNALHTSCSSCLGRSDRPRLKAQSVVSGGATRRALFADRSWCSIGRPASAPDGGAAIGIGICELVDLEGTVRSTATIDWRDCDVEATFAAISRVRLESDVRAAGRAEARLGASRSSTSCT